MFSNHAFSPLWAKTSHFQGGLIGETKSLSTQRKGHVIQLQVPSSLVYHSQCRLNSVKLFNRYQRLSALTSSQRNTKSLRCNCKELSSFNATLDHEYASYPEIDHSAKISLSRQLNAFYRFSRPHTVIGTVVGITSVSLLPVETMSDISLRFLIGLLKALVPAILMNIYVVGLNQLYDVEIDKVNKPDLPLASGEFSMKTGAAIVATFSTLSFAMGLTFQSPPLLSALVISFLLGSAYSIDLPFLRWKKHAFLAATCILSVRALVVQLAFFVHIQKYVLGRPVAFTKSLVFATFFMCFFTAVIALFKDIPDVDGDKHFGIQSFSVQIGQERVFWLCISMLLMAYGAAIVLGASSSSTFSKLVTVLGHSTLASILLLRARSINPMNKESVTSFYMFIWKLFYVEYLLIPFVR